MIKVQHIVGARPNFVKMAAVFAALTQVRRIKQSIVHTGQHFSPSMSDAFFEDLNLPCPVANLRVKSDSNLRRTAEIMLGFDKEWRRDRPDLVLVYGDVTSSLAAALAASKSGVRFGHVEAGMRSFDRSMPEEINRVLIDQLADILFAPSVQARKNLERERISAERIHVVGNVAIDTLRNFRSRAKLRTLDIPEKYGVATLHRPSNVDDPVALRRIWNGLADFSRHIPLVFPVHPRTEINFARFRIRKNEPYSNVRLVKPLRYLEFLALLERAAVVLTDSGGVQAEALFLGKPCFVLRDSVEGGIDAEFASTDLPALKPLFLKSIAKQRKTKERKSFVCDGRAADRIRAVILDFCA